MMMSLEHERTDQSAADYASTAPRLRIEYNWPGVPEPEH
jgi:hypothetical protein